MPPDAPVIAAVTAIPSDKEIARLCNSSYARPFGDLISWDHFDDGSDGDGICWGMRRFGDVDVLVLRGSVTMTDWFRDFFFIANPFKHRDLREVHAGFLLGMAEMWQEAKQIIGPKVIVAGHSLGAARADVLAAMMTVEGRAPIARVVFGEPYPGFQSFTDIIKDVPARSYCNGDDSGHDLVTNVPIAMMPDFPYVRPTPLVQCSASPDKATKRELRFFAYHHMPLYVAALEKESVS